MKSPHGKVGLAAASLCLIAACSDEGTGPGKPAAPWDVTVSPAAGAAGASFLATRGLDPESVLAIRPVAGGEILDLRSRLR